MIEIKNVDGRVLYTSNKETIRNAVEEAVAISYRPASSTKKKQR